MIPGLGRSVGGEHDSMFQYSCLENPRGKRSLVGYSLLGCKESDTTEGTEHARTSETHLDFPKAPQLFEHRF